MLERYRQIILTSIGVMILAATAITSPTLAVDVFGGCSGQSDSSVCQAAGTDDAGNLMANIVQILLFLLGAVAVIVIIIAGFNYVTANGDANRIQKSKNILLYAVVGLVVAIFAYAIVDFVVSEVGR